MQLLLGYSFRSLHQVTQLHFLLQFGALFRVYEAILVLILLSDGVFKYATEDRDS